jgi:hypothetical protein
MSGDEQRDRAEQHRLETAATAGTERQQINLAARRRQHGCGFTFDQFTTHGHARSLLAMTDSKIDDALRVCSIEIRVPPRGPGAWPPPCVHDLQLGPVAFGLGNRPVQCGCGSIRTVDTDRDPTQMGSQSSPSHDHRA